VSFAVWMTENDLNAAKSPLRQTQSGLCQLE
jgi:hypothetical protein